MEIKKHNKHANSKYNFSPFANEYEVMSTVQNDFDNSLQALKIQKQLTLSKIAQLLDDLEIQMDLIDQQREKCLFNPRIRNEWTDSMIKQYIINGGELGAEIQQNQFNDLIVPYLFAFETMKANFENNQHKLPDFYQYSDFFKFLQDFSSKFSNSLILTTNNLIKNQMPAVIVYKFLTLREIKTEVDDKGNTRILNLKSAQVHQIKDLIIDQFQQLQQVLMTTEIDYLKLEGNLSGQDLVDAKLFSTKSYEFLLECIKNGARIKFLDLSNVQVRSLQKSAFSKDKELENQNMEAIFKILDAICQSPQALQNLEGFSIQNTKFNHAIAELINKILKQNFIKELYLNSCGIGQDENIFNVLVEGLSANRSLRGIELNDNYFTDEMGVALLKPLVFNASRSDNDNPLKLHKLCLKNNFLDEKSGVLINSIMMKCQMRFLDISNNRIVLRFLDNIIVTSGYKFSLEYMGIEGNNRIYQGKNGSCTCLSSSSSKSKKTTTVSDQQLKNRDIRVIKLVDQRKFSQAKINILKQRALVGTYLKWRQQNIVNEQQQQEDEFDRLRQLKTQNNSQVNEANNENMNNSNNISLPPSGRKVQGEDQPQEFNYELVEV